MDPTSAELPHAPPSHLNPWLSLWLRPRPTMRQILDTDPRRMVVPLVLLYGVLSGLTIATFPALPEFVPRAIVGAVGVVVLPLLGLVALYLGGFLLRLTGGWLEGQGDAVAVRCALAWSCVPGLWVGVLFALPQNLLLAREGGGMDPSEMFDNPGLLLGRLALLVLGLCLSLWQIVIKLKCLAEAHRFSAWRALGSAVLACLLVVTTASILVVGIAALIWALHP